MSDSSESSESNKRRKIESKSDDAATEVESASASASASASTTAENGVVAPSDDASTAEVEFAYKVGETVLAYHGPLMYQAKVL